MRIGIHMATYSPSLPAVFGALSDPTRLAVVELLVKGPASVSDLSRPFAISRPSFLKHLHVLEKVGMVTSVKAGRVRTVSLAPDALGWIDKWVQAHRQHLEARLDRLAGFLEEDQ